MAIPNTAVALKYIQMASKIARKSTCLRRSCGAVIVKNNKVVGRGYNSPPKNLESQRRCLCNKESYNKKVTLKTCCIHAEMRAIADCLARNPKQIKGSTLYFTSIDKNSDIIFSKKPYCTICSQTALDAGIKYFVLNHEYGPRFYDTETYNDLSYTYSE